MTPGRIQSALDVLDGFAVTARLDPDTQTMQFRSAGLPDWLADRLRECRQIYTEALRFRVGVCIRCGDDARKRPVPGRSRIYDPDTGVPVGWEPAPVRGWDPLWCNSCYERGAWEEWSWGIPMKGGPRGAGSKTKAEDDGLFDGIEEPVPGEARLF